MPFKMYDEHTRAGSHNQPFFGTLQSVSFIVITPYLVGVPLKSVTLKNDSEIYSCNYNRKHIRK